MRVIEGGKGKKKDPTPKERAQKAKLSLQTEFYRNLKKMIPEIPGDDLYDTSKYEISMTREKTQEGMTLVMLKWKVKQPKTPQRQ